MPRGAGQGDRWCPIPGTSRPCQLPCPFGSGGERAGRRESSVRCDCARTVVAVKGPAAAGCVSDADGTAAAVHAGAGGSSSRFRGLMLGTLNVPIHWLRCRPVPVPPSLLPPSNPTTSSIEVNPRKTPTPARQVAVRTRRDNHPRRKQPAPRGAAETKRPEEMEDAPKKTPRASARKKIFPFNTRLSQD